MEESYSVDCPYREESEYGGDRCNRFGIDEVDEEICGGCRVADQILEADDEPDLGDLL